MDTNKFLSEHINDKMVTLTSETLSYEDCFEPKIQAKFDKYDQFLNNHKKN